MQNIQKNKTFDNAGLLSVCTAGEKTELSGLHSERVRDDPSRAHRDLVSTRLDYCNVLQRRDAAQ